jgi:hypothetical protein
MPPVIPCWREGRRKGRRGGGREGRREGRRKGRRDGRLAEGRVSLDFPSDGQDDTSLGGGEVD